MTGVVCKMSEIVINLFNFMFSSRLLKAVVISILVMKHYE